MNKIGASKKHISARALAFLVVAAMTGPRLHPLQEKKKELQYQISVSSISIAVTVQDKRGKYINDLTREDFAVYESGAKQSITYFNQDSGAPLSLTVLLDVSGSMALQDKLKESKEALRYFLTSVLSPGDEVSLLIFADGEVEVASRFATDKKDFLAVLDKTEAYGQTALNDAVAVSPEFAKKGRNEKRALVLITDGIENDSRSSPEQAIEIARKVEVPIYAVGVKIPTSELYLRKHKRAASLSPMGIIDTLEKFSLTTGGKAFMIDTLGELAGALREIKRELGHQYIIGFTSYKSTAGDYRKIRVETKKKNYTVRTREGH